MTRNKLNELIEKSKQFLNNEIVVDKGIDEETGKRTLTPFRFTGTGKQIMFKEEGKEVFKINGVLKLNEEIIERDLITIVDYFENKKAYI